MSEENAYIYGTDDDELRRLGAQHALWRSDAEAHWTRAGFGSGMTVADIGCGPGFTSMDLAARVGPTGRVLAFDRSTRYLDHLRARGDARLSIFEIDVRDLHLDERCIDGAYLRWVLTFIEDLEVVLKPLVGALRPGGTIAIFDYLYWPGLTWGPRNSTCESIRRAVMASYRAHGTNPEVAGQVPACLFELGMVVDEMRPVIRLARPGDALWSWPQTWLDNFLPRLVEEGHLTASEHQAWATEWRDNASDPAGFFLTPPLLEIVAHKPAGP